MRNRPLNPALRPPPDYGAAYHHPATHISQMQTSPKHLSDHDCNGAPGSGKGRACGHTATAETGAGEWQCLPRCAGNISCRAHHGRGLTACWPD
jgi:hypothetical protein